MPNPLCQIKHAVGSYETPTNGFDATPGETVTIKLASDSGVDVWELVCFGTDELSDAAVITASLVIDPLLKTATFTAPVAGRTWLFRSTVNRGVDADGQKQASYHATFGVFTKILGNRVLGLNERLESNATFGWIVDFNSWIRAGAGGGGGGGATPGGNEGDLQVNQGGGLAGLGGNEGDTIRRVNGAWIAEAGLEVPAGNNNDVLGIDAVGNLKNLGPMTGGSGNAGSGTLTDNADGEHVVTSKTGEVFAASVIVNGEEPVVTGISDSFDARRLMLFFPNGGTLQQNEEATAGQKIRTPEAEDFVVAPVTVLMMVYIPTYGESEGGYWVIEGSVLATVTAGVGGGGGGVSAVNPDTVAWKGLWGSGTTYAGLGSWPGTESPAGGTGTTSGTRTAVANFNGPNADSTSFPGFTVPLFNGNNTDLTLPGKLGDFITHATGVCEGIIVAKAASAATDDLVNFYANPPCIGEEAGVWGVAFSTAGFSFFFNSATGQKRAVAPYSPGAKMIGLFRYDGSNIEVSVDGGDTWFSEPATWAANTVFASGRTTYIGRGNTSNFNGPIARVYIRDTVGTRASLAAYAASLAATFAITL